MVRRVAVVGAGSSGLACIKICVDEGLEPVCFESSDDIGGLWRFKEAPELQRASIYRSLVVNTSKEMMCFSDFPMPDDYPNYMLHSQLLQYLSLYAEHFHLLRYINFQTTVRSVTHRPDFSLSGQWDVVTINRDGEEERLVFDAVLVCSGPYTNPTLPLSGFPGYETFTGRCFHSWEYKDAEALRGKRVVVVGLGNSGGDIAVEISRSSEKRLAHDWWSVCVGRISLPRLHPDRRLWIPMHNMAAFIDSYPYHFYLAGASGDTLFISKTFLSTREGAWVTGRMSTNGLPLDMMNISRRINILKLLLPQTLINWVVERALNQKYDHRLYGLQPRHRILDRGILINDDLPGKILQGALVLKPNLKAFVETGVVFEDGTVEENIDAVVFCTGYNGTFPFLPPALSEGTHGELTLYKRLFPPSLQHPTLAIMAFFRTSGPIMPIVEMQARWAVKVFSGSRHLPSQEKMLEVLESDRQRSMKSSTCPLQAALQVDYITYVDFMAKEVGVQPNLLALLLRDPVLWVKVVFGPFTPYQFRLTGPGQWAGARHAILTQWKRVAQPFKTRAVPEPEPGQSVFSLPGLLTLGGSVIMAVLLSKNLPALQGAAEFLERRKIFLMDNWYTG